MCIKLNFRENHTKNHLHTKISTSKKKIYDLHKYRFKTKFFHKICYERERDMQMHNPKIIKFKKYREI